MSFLNTNLNYRESHCFNIHLNHFICIDMILFSKIDLQVTRWNKTIKETKQRSDNSLYFPQRPTSQLRVDPCGLTLFKMPWTPLNILDHGNDQSKGQG